MLMSTVVYNAEHADSYMDIGRTIYIHIYNYYCDYMEPLILCGTWPKYSSWGNNPRSAIKHALKL